MSNATTNQLDSKYITTIDGKEFVLYAGLLELAHRKGISKLEVTLLKVPSTENGMEAICRAVAVGENGEFFADIGDANPNNTDSEVSVHLLRIASTRAKARVLRDFNNIGMTSVEELHNIGSGKNSAPKATNGNGNVAKIKPISSAQKRAILGISGRRKMNEAELDEYVRKEFGLPLDDLSTAQASNLIQMLNSAA